MSKTIPLNANARVRGGTLALARKFYHILESKIIALHIILDQRGIPQPLIRTKAFKGDTPAQERVAIVNDLPCGDHLPEELGRFAQRTHTLADLDTDIAARSPGGWRCRDRTSLPPSS